MLKETPLLGGHYYHLYNRGNNGQSLFFEERNYHYFFKLYIYYIYPVADTFAYCLMKNHFHLLVKMKLESDLTGFKNLSGLDVPNYSKQFSNFFNAYAKAINKTYGRTGSLFERPFKRIQVDSDSYFIQLISYIHRNPQKHGFVSDYRTYPYSSYQTIQQQKNSRIKTQQVLNWFGSAKLFEDYHQQMNELTIRHLIEDDI
jgi:REP element-mobilizing transposase RayT